MEEKYFKEWLDRIEDKIDALFKKYDVINDTTIRNDTRISGLTGLVIAMPVIVTIALSVIFFIFK